MFYSLALSKKLSLIHGDFLTYQDVLHMARDLLGSPRSFLFTYYLFKKKYIESYNQLDILHEARDINYGQGSWLAHTSLSIRWSNDVLVLGNVQSKLPVESPSFLICLADPCCLRSLVFCVMFY
jgi:hypothetical protein